MASGHAPCLGCQERDRELLHLRRRLAVLNEEHQSLQRENHRLVRRLAKVERQNHELRQRLDEVRREQHRQTHPFRRKKTKAGKPKKPARPKGPPPRPPPGPPSRADRPQLHRPPARMPYRPRALVSPRRGRPVPDRLAAHRPPRHPLQHRDRLLPLLPPTLAGTAPRTNL